KRSRGHYISKNDDESRSTLIAPLLVEYRPENGTHLLHQAHIASFFVVGDIATHGVWISRAEECGWNFWILGGELQGQLTDRSTLRLAETGGLPEESPVFGSRGMPIGRPSIGQQSGGKR